MRKAKRYSTKLTLASGLELTWHWIADDATHAAEQLLQDPGMWNAEDNEVISLIIEEAK